MEENIISVEQPEILVEADVQVLAQEKQNETENVEKEKAIAKTGSAEKFKTEFELKKAYECLEAEFTRKSQKLKELEKIVESFKTQSTENLNENTLENDDFNLLTSNAQWAEKVQEFVETNKYASAYAEDISQELLNDKSILTKNDPLNEAWARVASKKFVDKNELVCDDDFIENYVLKNETIKEKLLKQIVLDSYKNPVPKLISNCGNSFTVSKPFCPQSFEEARDSVEKIFN